MNNGPYDKLREEIAAIDQKLAELLKRRAEMSEQIGREKKKRGDSVRKPELEEKKLEAFGQEVGPRHASRARVVLKCVMRWSAGIQRRVSNEGTSADFSQDQN